MKINLLYFFGGWLTLLSLSMISAWTVDDLIHHIVVCSQPPIYGKCKFRQHKWHYVSKLRRCERFIYSGCGGNDNVFYSKHECEEYCQI